MKKFIASMVFLLIAAICFTGNAIAVSILKSSFAGGQSEVGYSLLIVSGICLAFVVFFLLQLEKDYQCSKKGANES